MSAVALPDGIDAVVFRTVSATKAKPRKLAKENPKKGDAVWLVASLDDRPKDQIVHRGSLVEVWENLIKCKFDDGNLVMRGASGAPYINDAGDVVGLHTGSFKEPGNVAGCILPVEAIRKAVESAMKGQVAKPT